MADIHPITPCAVLLLLYIYRTVYHVRRMPHIVCRTQPAVQRIQYAVRRREIASYESTPLSLIKNVQRIYNNQRTRQSNEGLSSIHRYRITG